MLSKAIELKCLEMIKLGKKCPMLSHLFFADDSLFFLNAKKEYGAVLQNIFEKYYAGSGKMINFNKSSVIFSANVLEQVRTEMASQMQMGAADNLGKYLGIPSV